MQPDIMKQCFLLQMCLIHMGTGLMFVLDGSNTRTNLVSVVR